MVEKRSNQYALKKNVLNNMLDKDEMEQLNMLRNNKGVLWFNIRQNDLISDLIHMVSVLHDAQLHFSSAPNSQAALQNYLDALQASQGAIVAIRPTVRKLRKNRMSRNQQRNALKNKNTKHLAATDTISNNDTERINTDTPTLDEQSKIEAKPDVNIATDMSQLENLKALSERLADKHED